MCKLSGMPKTYTLQQLRERALAMGERQHLIFLDQVEAADKRRLAVGDKVRYVGLGGQTGVVIGRMPGNDGRPVIAWEPESTLGRTADGMLGGVPLPAKATAAPEPELILIESEDQSH